MTIQPFASPVAEAEAEFRELEANIGAPRPHAPAPAAPMAPKLALRFELAASAGAGLTRFDIERVLGSNDLVGVGYLAQGIAASRPVARLIFAGGKGYATGFLVAPRLLLTNRHVFGTADDARGALAEFGYELSGDGGAPPSETFRLDPDALFVAGAYDPSVPREADLLDYALVAVAERSDRGSPLSDWGVPAPGRPARKGRGSRVRHDHPAPERRPQADRPARERGGEEGGAAARAGVPHRHRPGIQRRAVLQRPVAGRGPALPRRPGDRAGHGAREAAQQHLRGPPRPRAHPGAARHGYRLVLQPRRARQPHLRAPARGGGGGAPGRLPRQPLARRAAAGHRAGRPARGVAPGRATRRRRGRGAGRGRRRRGRR